MESLREEINEAHAARSELLKWKLVIVGSVGSIGLGLAGASVRHHADLVLAAIPLICIYVDLLCMNLNLRMIAIGTWQRGHEAVNGSAVSPRNYEEFVGERRYLFALEDWALNYSTRVLSAAVGAYGALGVLFGGDLATLSESARVARLAVAAAFILSGAIGLLGSFAADRWQYRKLRRDRLDSMQWGPRGEVIEAPAAARRSGATAGGEGGADGRGGGASAEPHRSRRPRRRASR